jgi:hypothetical protein
MKLTRTVLYDLIREELDTLLEADVEDEARQRAQDVQQIVNQLKGMVDNPNDPEEMQSVLSLVAQEILTL